MEQNKIDRSQYETLLKNGNFIFYLQPLVLVKTGEIVGAEALSRCILDDNTVVYPDSFIPEMERNGFIVEFDYYILSKVCEHIANRLKNNQKAVTVAINLSRKHLERPDSAKIIKETVEKYGVPAHYIDIEITETLLVSDFDSGKRFTEELRKAGFKIAIDDFGAGYAGIDIWRKLDFDIIKIDRSFLLKDEKSSKNATLLPEIINTAVRMNNEVICEGVETEQDCKRLLLYGCDYAQGYYFSKPVCVEEFYRIYDEKKGFYEIKNITKTYASCRNIKSSSKVKLISILSFFICIILLLPSVMSTILFRRQSRNIKEKYDSIVIGSINSDVDKKINYVNSYILELTRTMESFAILMSSAESTDDVNQYIESMSDANEEVMFKYLSKDQMDKLDEINYLTQDEKDSFEKGINFVSPIHKKNSRIPFDYFTVGVPVVVNNESVGCLKAFVDTSILIEINQRNLSYGNIYSVNILNTDGIVIKSDRQNIEGSSISDILQEIDKVSEDEKAILLNSIQTNSNYCSKLTDDSHYFINYKYMKDLDSYYCLIINSETEMSFLEEVVNTSHRNSVLVCVTLIGLMLITLIFVYISVKKVKQSKKKWEAVEMFMDTAVIIYNVKYDLLQISSNAKNIFYFEKSNIYHYLSKLRDNSAIYQADKPILYNAILLNKKIDYNEIRIRMKLPDGKKFNWFLIQMKYEYKKGKLSAVVGKVTNIDLFQNESMGNEYNAQHDLMLGLYNRIYFENIVMEKLREGINGILVVMDVDYFKKTNDTYGHLFGDNILKFISENLKSVFPTETLGRIGGDEFAIYIENQKSVSEVKERIMLLQEKIREYSDNGEQIRLSISFGYSSYPEDGNTFNELYKVADSRMYDDKKEMKSLMKKEMHRDE